jgi:hypothetical protein
VTELRDVTDVEKKNTKVDRYLNRMGLLIKNPTSLLNFVLTDAENLPSEEKLKQEILEQEKLIKS